MNYEDIVKPSTFADEDYYHRLTLGLRQQNNLTCIKANEYRPFWVVSKHSDILEIEKQTVFLKTHSTLSSKQKKLRVFLRKPALG